MTRKRTPNFAEMEVPPPNAGEPSQEPPPLGLIKGTVVSLEFLLREEIKLARVIQSSDQPLGRGWTFELTSNGRRIYLYERFLRRVAPRAFAVLSPSVGNT